MAVTSRFAFQSALARRAAWHVVDASEHILGRLATQIAVVLQGKHKPFWEPSFDCGDYVVVVNAEKIQMSAEDKWRFKLYRWHTGYPGGLKEVPAARMREEHPTRLLEKAVHGMLPKNRLLLGREKKLRLFAGPTHNLSAQVDDPLNKSMLEALDYKWQKTRPEDVDPVRKYYPGWLVHLEQDGDFTVAHRMKMWQRPSSKAKLRDWKPSEQIPVFMQALRQSKEARQKQRDEEQRQLDQAWAETRKLDVPATMADSPLSRIVDPNPREWPDFLAPVDGFKLPDMSHVPGYKEWAERFGIAVPSTDSAASSTDSAASSTDAPAQPAASEEKQQ